MWLLIAVIVLLVLGAGAAIDEVTGVPISTVTDVFQNFFMSSRVQQLAEAIARAEGFYVAGSIPAVAHNPGDLVLGSKGNSAVYRGTTYSGTIQGKTIFASDAEGWNALYRQVQAMLDGSSAYYDPTQSIADIGSVYAGGDPNWATNVAAALGISPDTSLGDWAQTTSDGSENA